MERLSVAVCLARRPLPGTPLAAPMAAGPAPSVGSCGGPMCSLVNCRRIPRSGGPTQSRTNNGLWRRSPIPTPPGGHNKTAFGPRRCLPSSSHSTTYLPTALHLLCLSPPAYRTIPSHPTIQTTLKPNKIHVNSVHHPQHHYCHYPSNCRGFVLPSRAIVCFVSSFQRWTAAFVCYLLPSAELTRAPIIPHRLGWLALFFRSCRLHRVLP